MKDVISRLNQQWKEAAYMAEMLLNENNWSKATYCYMFAIALYEENQCVTNERIIDSLK